MRKKERILDNLEDKKLYFARAKILQKRDIEKRAEGKADRCRYGVKTDLAESKLVRLKGIDRVRGRKLFKVVLI